MGAPLYSARLFIVGVCQIIFKIYKNLVISIEIKEYIDSSLAWTSGLMLFE
jgi:hypothetical protein